MEVGGVPASVALLDGFASLAMTVWKSSPSLRGEAEAIQKR